MSNSWYVLKVFGIPLSLHQSALKYSRLNILKYRSALAILDDTLAPSLFLLNSQTTMLNWCGGKRIGDLAP